MWDSIKSGFKTGTDWLNNNQDAVGTVAGLGSLAMQYKGMQDMQDSIEKQNALSQKAFNNQMNLQERELAQENMAQNNFTQGFQNSALGGEKKKKKKLGDYSGMMNYGG